MVRGDGGSVDGISRTRPGVIYVNKNAKLSIVLEGLGGVASGVATIIAITSSKNNDKALHASLGVLPPKSVQRYVLSLSRARPLVGGLLVCHFGRKDLAKRDFNGLFLTTVAKVSRNGFISTIGGMDSILGIAKRILPIASHSIHLVTELRGRVAICKRSGVKRYARRCGDGVTRITLRPVSRDNRVLPLPRILRTVRGTSLVALNPKDLCADILPGLVMGNVTRTIRDTGTEIICVGGIVARPKRASNCATSSRIGTVLDRACPSFVSCYVMGYKGTPGRLLRGCTLSNTTIIYNSISGVRRENVGIVASSLVRVGSRNLVHRGDNTLTRAVTGLLPGR